MRSPPLPRAPRAPALRRTLTVAALLLAAACSKKIGVDQRTGPSGNDDGQLAPCEGQSPDQRGGAMRFLGRLGDTCFSMHVTEVSADDYAEFLAAPAAEREAAASVADALRPGCGAADLAAGGATSGAQPVTGVGWCAAAAYCDWVGTRLCGPYEHAGTTRHEFVTTCTDGDHAGFSPAALTASCTSTAVREVGSLAACVTPTGVYDLVGNAAEWVDDCDATGCRVRGGSYADTGTALGCEAARRLPVDQRADTVGFRCCADE